MRTTHGYAAGLILALACIVIALLAILPPLMEAAAALNGAGK